MNHEISLEEAVALTKRYRELRNTIINPTYLGKDIIANSETFDRAAFDSLLAQGDCQQIRVYYGLGEDLKVHAVIVGVDSNGADILPGAATEGLIMENSKRCPDVCPPASALNL